MITRENYLEAKKIVDTYEKEQLNKHIVTSSVVVREDCPDEYWYSHRKGERFNIKTCHRSDLIDVEGFGGKDPNECWKVADGEYAGNVLAKQHCL